MSPGWVFLTIALYFLMLVGISFLVGRKSDNATFFLGNKKSPWFVVAFGMIGASLSGVTFISVPGWVDGAEFSYMQMVLGYLAGYAVIALVLMPLYYRLNLVSIYQYLESRFGRKSYLTGSGFFLLSRTIGASFRLFLVANVLQITLFNALNIPFWVTVMVTILLIWLYTFRSGIRTIVFTDTLQTLFMLLAVGIAIVTIQNKMGLSFTGLVDTIETSPYSKWFFWEDWGSQKHFVRQFFSGMFITIVMTGLDQDMMQKNLTCHNIKDAQKNMLWFSVILVVVNLCFLSLGALLYLYAGQSGIQATGDDLFAVVATQGDLGMVLGIFFILGLIAAAYSSADSALTSLTTAFCVDFLRVQMKSSSTAIRDRKMVHVGFSVLLFLVILVFSMIKDENVISALFRAAGYTYGPLLGLYSFGLLTKRKVLDDYVPFICLASPIIWYLLNLQFPETFGFELLIYNGATTFLGLFLISRSK